MPIMPETRRFSNHQSSSANKTTTMALYSKVEYWNERYHKSRNQPPYEWYQNYNTLNHLLNPETLSGCSGKGHINMTSSHDDDASASTTTATNATSAKAFKCLHPNHCRVLILGCGNSQFGANLFEAGWRGGNEGRFVQVDFSPVVIDQMKERYNDEYYKGVLGHSKKKDGRRMEFVCADITKPLNYPNGSFDLIVCKGVFDAVLCSNGSVFNIRRMVKQCVRLLNDDGGVLMVVTYGNPDNRVVFLEGEDGELETYWQGVSVHNVPSMVRTRKTGHHNSNKNDYVYLCRKRRGAWKESYATSGKMAEASQDMDGGRGAENHTGFHDVTFVPQNKTKESHGAKQV